ncbi:MAG TPA: bL35 family ribosomal protein [Candidatus Saccharimonadales bacterium]|nr:bL35 family ribosomal protein [Candidatus Saccharimonadales bacterium]
MPKLKTHSGTKDRVRITKNGKVLHGHGTSNHFLEKKSASRKRRFAVSGRLTGKSAKNIKLKLGVK